MSRRFNLTPSLAGINYSGESEADVQKLFHASLNSGIHGLCFSPYEEGQQPGDQLSEAQVQRRLEIIRPYTNWVRSFSCTEGNELIARIAKELGMKTMVGAWLGDEADKNEVEIQELIKMSEAGLVDIAAVGNEVLYRNDLSSTELLSHIQRVKAAVPHSVEVGYVDAYYEFTVHPEITAACDVILANCYPYWEKCPFEHSLVYMKQMYQQAKDAAGGKRVIISETGWPSQGTGLEGAVPSAVNAMGYFINANQWAKQADVELFYFTSFDESWKVAAEGDVGAYWGLWDKDERVKFS